MWRVHRANPDRTVDALGDEVRMAIFQDPLQIDLGMARQELQHRGQQLRLPERVRHQHPQPPARHVHLAAQVGLDRVPVGDQCLGMGEAPLAVFGEGHAVRRALEQLQAEQALQGLKTPAHGWLRGAELGRSG